MDDLRFNVLFDSISFISGQWVADNERLRAVEPRLRSKDPRLKRGLSPGLPDQLVSAYPLNYRSSSEDLAFYGPTNNSSFVLSE